MPVVKSSLAGQGTAQGILDAPWIPAEPFRRARAGRAHTAHIACAALVCFAASGDNLLLEIAGVPLWICFVLRARSTLAASLWVFTLPTTIAFLAWVAWQFLSLSWSLDPREGLDQLGRLRWAWIAWMLYPVLEARRLLILAVPLGYLIAQSSQLAQWLGFRLDIPALTFHGDPARISGWWHPVGAGELLVIALGFCLPPALMGRGPGRACAGAAAIAAAVGILASGTRGAWLAGAAMVACALLFAVWRMRSNRRAILIAAGIAVAAMLIAGIVMRGPIAQRFDAGVREVRAALGEGRYATSTGARIAMARWSLDAARAHPVGGIGVGSFYEWSKSRAAAEGLAPDPIMFHGHAHNTPLHALATTGMVGLGLFLVFWALLARAAIRAVHPDRWGTIDAGPVFALLGITLCWPFDTVFGGSQIMANIAVIAALCPSRSPPGPP